MPPNFKKLERTRDSGLTIVSLSRPKTMNALTHELKQELDTVTSDFFSDPEQRCLLITGSGNAFCAGGDLQALKNGHTPAETRERLKLSHNWARRLLSEPKPVIMAVNGAAAGAGFSLAMMGDIVLASDTAYFLPGFAQVGVVPDLALGLTLPRAVGNPRARDILLNNRRIDALEAQRIGLVSRVLLPTDLMPTAIEMGQRLARGAGLALGLTKVLLATGQSQTLDSFLPSEIAAQTLAFASADCREGVAAFFERREPVFAGH